MSEFKGTRGPWNLSRTKRFVKSGYGAPFVCEIDATNGQWEANAHLIASAPDLLEALQEACEIIQDLNRELNNHGGMIDDETFPEGLAAIAKALGEGQ